MTVQNVLKGSTANLSFNTRDANRTLVNADTLPTITGVQFDGSPLATTGFSVVQQQTAVPANITGRYYVVITNTVTANFSTQKSGEVQISATIGGVVCTEELKFYVVPTSTNTAYIDTN